jgi:hypothetical protein
MKMETATLLQAGTMNDELRLTNTSVLIPFVISRRQKAAPAIFIGVPHAAVLRHCP